MKIIIINGSPKTVKNNSEILGNYLFPLLKENNIKKYYSIYFQLNDKTKNEIYNSDILIFIFPLYVDGIPSNLLKLLVKFEKENVIRPETKIYCIVNNGFYEGKQNFLTLLHMKNWCKKVNAKWGQGIGIGSGELLPYLKKFKLGQGPLKNLEKILNSDKNIYINPNWPKSLYFIQGPIPWILEVRKNNLKIRELFKKE